MCVLLFKVILMLHYNDADGTIVLGLNYDTQKLCVGTQSRFNSS